MLKRLFYSGPSREILHEEYAKKGQIDHTAPIKTTSEIYIQAPIEQVWNLLINLPGWPTIDSSFRSVRLKTTVAIDAQFNFILYNFPINAKFAVITPHRELIWTGTSLWFKAVDMYRLEPARNTGTMLLIAESFAGVLAPVFMTSTQLKAQHDKWLMAFKLAVEKLIQV